MIVMQDLIIWSEAQSTHIISEAPFHEIFRSKTGSYLIHKKKWQREWNRYSENKLRKIKSSIVIRPTFTSRKIAVILTHLRIGLSRLTHRHLLLAIGEPTSPYCHSLVFIIHHFLIDCLGFQYMYRWYFHTSSQCLMKLLSENPHHEIFTF